tara:strand:+ start:1324 stop:1569 length:246 start_codon:yes stop_codon:yes gene_type:complete
MRQTEITSFEQASEDLYNKAREALKVLSTTVKGDKRLEETLPKHVIDQLIALRNAVWEQERWMGLESEMAPSDYELDMCGQ